MTQPMTQPAMPQQDWRSLVEHSLTGTGNTKSEEAAPAHCPFAPRSYAAGHLLQPFGVHLRPRRTQHSARLPPWSIQATTRKITQLAACRIAFHTRRACTPASAKCTLAGLLWQVHRRSSHCSKPVPAHAPHRSHHPCQAHTGSTAAPLRTSPWPSPRGRGLQSSLGSASLLLLR